MSILCHRVSESVQEWLLRCVRIQEKHWKNLTFFHDFLTFQESCHAVPGSFRNTILCHRAPEITRIHPGGERDTKKSWQFLGKMIFPEKSCIISWRVLHWGIATPNWVLALSVHYSEPTHARTGEKALRYPSDLSDQQCAWFCASFVFVLSMRGTLRLYMPPAR
jgi:hypothetical protein